MPLMAIVYNLQYLGTHIHQTFSSCAQFHELLDMIYYSRHNTYRQVNTFCRLSCSFPSSNLPSEHRQSLENWSWGQYFSSQLCSCDGSRPRHKHKRKPVQLFSNLLLRWISVLWDTQCLHDSKVARGEVLGRQWWVSVHGYPRVECDKLSIELIINSYSLGYLRYSQLRMHQWVSLVALRVLLDCFESVVSPRCVVFLASGWACGFHTTSSPA
jgi:hypothetical protein